MDLQHIPQHQGSFKEHERVIFLHRDQIKTGHVIRDNGKLGDLDISTSPKTWVRIKRENVRICTAKNLRAISKPAIPQVAKPTGIQAKPETQDFLISTYERVSTPVISAYAVKK